jgi:hypothetical protein
MLRRKVFWNSDIKAVSFMAFNAYIRVPLIPGPMEHSYKA